MMYLFQLFLCVGGGLMLTGFLSGNSGSCGCGCEVKNPLGYGILRNAVVYKPVVPKGPDQPMKWQAFILPLIVSLGVTALVMLVSQIFH